MTVENTTKKDHTIAKLVAKCATSYTVGAVIAAVVSPATLVGFAAVTIGSGVLGAHVSNEVDDTVDELFEMCDDIKEEVSEAITNVSKSVKTKVAA